VSHTDHVPTTVRTCGLPSAGVRVWDQGQRPFEEAGLPAPHEPS
jgi:hypothetical protein